MIDIILRELATGKDLVCGKDFLYGGDMVHVRLAPAVIFNMNEGVYRSFNIENNFYQGISLNTTHELNTALGGILKDCVYGYGNNLYVIIPPEFKENKKIEELLEKYKN